jgi:pimeloyl-ACP methyl ester carboxylesterase
MLIYGDHDTETPLAIAHTLEDAIEGAQLSVIAGAGHHLHLDAAQQVAELTKDFLRA